mgnify:CR=1 FL=1
MKFLATLTIALMCFGAVANTGHGSKKKKKDKNPAQKEYTFEVDGRVIGKNGKPVDFMVTVYEEGKVVHTVESKKGLFNFGLAENVEAMIEISAEGYYPKRIAFKTKDDTLTKKNPSCYLDLLLYAKDEYPELKKIDDVVDMPVAYISYDEKGKIYDINQKQSQALRLVIVRTIRRAKEMAKI